jgi:hypothetical protein
MISSTLAPRLPALRDGVPRVLCRHASADGYMAKSLGYGLR